MSRECPSCKTPIEPEDKFCTGCGARIASHPTAGSPAEAADLHTPLPELPDLLSAARQEGAAGSEIVVEVETDRPHVHNHASLLRFRVTSNLQAACGVTIRMRLHGQGRLVEQTAEEIEQRCRFEGRGEQHIFSFPFRGLIPGQIRVDQLRVVVHRADKPGRPCRLELPDQSLFVSVSDPTMGASAPGIVIHDGIHLDFSQLKEMYGSDIKNLLSLNAQREAEPGQPPTQWQPIRLRVVDEVPLPAEFRLTLPGGVTLDLVRIRAGEFLMGSPEGQGRDDERPARRVRITRDFYLGKFPVTQEQYHALVGDNPSKFPLSPKHPVDNVSWEDARELCRRLRAHLAQSPNALSDDTVTVGTVGLPTEAEWEYACRAGTETLFPFGDDRKQLVDYGWYDKSSERTTHAIGQLKPNAWGLYDVHGNVWEWCEDFYSDDYASAGTQDPTGPQSGDRRVLRGGSWSCYARDCRSARRRAVEPDKRTHNYGFRIVLRVAATP